MSELPMPTFPISTIYFPFGTSNSSTLGINNVEEEINTTKALPELKKSLSISDPDDREDFHRQFLKVLTVSVRSMNLEKNRNSI